MRRRELLKVLGASIAGSRMAFAADAIKPHPLGIQLYTVRTLMEKSVEDTLEAIAKVGYREVEWAGFFNRSARDLRALLRQFGLVSPGGHIDFNVVRDPSAFARALDDAATLGQRYIVGAWIDEKDRRSVDDWKRIGAQMNAAGTLAQSHGLQFAFHNHEYEFVRVHRTLPYDILLAESDPALVKMEMDLYWLTLYGQDPLTYFAKYPGRFPLVHVKDRDAGGRMVDVGAGMIDFKRIFSKAGQAGIKHYFVEHDEPVSPMDSARRSYEGLRRLVA